MKILNVTQHAPTPEQRAAGVIDMDVDPRVRVLRWMTADTLESLQEDPSDPDMDLAEYEGSPGLRAHMIADVAGAEAKRLGCTHAMIGGAPWLMAPLEACLRQWGIRPLYAFSRRVSVDQPQADGSVRKVNEFRHEGFVEPAAPGPYLDCTEDLTAMTL